MKAKRKRCFKCKKLKDANKGTTAVPIRCPQGKQVWVCYECIIGE